MALCIISVAVVTLGVLIIITEQNEISYKCTENNVLIVQNKSNDFIKMHCALPRICGEIRNCLTTFSSGLCNGKGHYLMGVDETPDKSVRSTCCQYSPLVKSHLNDRCITQEVRDKFSVGSSNSGSVQETNSFLPTRPLTGQLPARQPNEIPIIPNHSSLSGSSSGSLPERSQNSVGSLPVVPEKRLTDNNELHQSDNGIVDLSLFKLTYKQAPVEIVKGIERIPNGFRVTSCIVECDQPTTSSVTSASVGGTVSLSATTLSTAYPVLLSSVKPGGGNDGGFGCRTLSSTTVSLINNIKQNKVYLNEGIPGFQEPGFYCDSAWDERCLNKCLMVLEARFKSATCDLSNNNCLCRQDANKKNFDENLKSMGLYLNDPNCNQNGNHGSGNNGSSSTRNPNSSSGTTGNSGQGSTKSGRHISDGGSTQFTRQGGNSDSTELGSQHQTGNTVPQSTQKINGGSTEVGISSSSQSGNQHHTGSTVPQSTDKGNSGSTHAGNGQNGGSTTTHDSNNGHGLTTTPSSIPDPHAGKGFGFRTAAEGGGGAPGCFSSDMLAYTRNGTKRMDQLKIGDEVMVISSDDISSYQPVELFYHRNPNIDFLFVNIKTKSGRTLSLTGNHLLVTVPCDHPSLSREELAFYTNVQSKFAHKVKTGLCVPSVINGRIILPDSIVEVRKVNKKGIFSPITSGGTLVVNGLHSSCYSTVENHLLQYTVHKGLTKMAQFLSPISSLFNFITDSSSVENSDEIPSILLYMLEVARLVLPSGVY